VLEVEMEDHLGYTKHESEGRNMGNSRSGTRSKMVLTEVVEVEVEVEVEVPRDREGAFEPPPGDASSLEHLPDG
jgi:transposase-like protein